MKFTTWQADNTKNKFQHVGTLKYHKVFTTRGHTCLTCRLCYRWRVHKYKCLSFFSFSFLSSFFKLRGRENMQLRPLRRVFSLLRGGWFIYIALAWRHRFYLSKILSASSPGVWHEIRPICSPRHLSSKLIFLFPISAWRKRVLFPL